MEPGEKEEETDKVAVGEKVRRTVLAYPLLVLRLLLATVWGVPAWSTDLPLGLLLLANERPVLEETATGCSKSSSCKRKNSKSGARRRQRCRSIIYHLSKSKLVALRHLWTEISGDAP